MAPTRRNRVLSIVFLAVFCALGIRAATNNVRVIFNELSPNPVLIEENDVVYWYTDDPFELFYVTVGGEFSPVPVAVTFPYPGTYAYTAGSAFSGGSWEGQIIVKSNSPPTVAITSPTNDTSLYAPATFQVTAEASDADPGDIQGVNFFVDGTLRGGVSAPPFSLTMTNLTVGRHVISAVAWDRKGATATHSVTTHVLPPPPIVLAISGVYGGKLVFSASELLPGRTNYLETATVLQPAPNWVRVGTNVATSATGSFTNSISPGKRFFRLVQVP